MLHKSGEGSSFKGIMRRLFIFFLIVPVLFANLLQAERVERKVGIQTFTFAKQTIEELLPLVRECGVDAIGLSRHALSKKYPDAMVEPSMSDEQKAFLKKILADNKIKVVSYGVSTPTTENAIRKLLSFVKEFGADTVIAEPSADKLPLWNKLCAEYGMKVAVHNHAKDAKRNPEFSDPKFVASMIADYSCSNSRSRICRLMRAFAPEVRYCNCRESARTACRQTFASSRAGGLPCG